MSSKKRRYNAFLEPDYDRHTVSYETHKRWEELSAEQSGYENDEAVGVQPIPSTSAFADTNETCTFNVHLPEANDDAGSGINGSLNMQSLSEHIDEVTSNEFNSTSSDSANDVLDYDAINESVDEHEVSCDDCFEYGDEGNSFDKQNLRSTVMFEESNVSLWEVLNMIQAMALRFNFSDEAKHAVFEFTKVLAGSRFQTLNITKYYMSKVFDAPSEHCTYAFYCCECCILLCEPVLKKNVDNKKSVLCQQCEKQYILSLTANNYFLSVDMEYQLRSILMNEDIRRELIKDNAKRIRNTILQDFYANDHIISDVHDGKRFLKCQYIKDKFDQNEVVLTLNMNTDGAPIFESSTKSMWPIQCIINELTPKLRFKTTLLAALWIPNAEPKPNQMNLYMSVFIKQMKNLMQNGIKIVDKFGKIYTFYCMLLSVPVDSVARPVLQNRVQYNGYSGCSWCYAFGKYSGRSIKYLMTENDQPERTHEMYLKDINDSIELERNVRGVKGNSELTTLPHFDCIWGFPSEYMHGTLLGVVRQLWDIWTDGKNRNRMYYLKQSDKQIIDKRLVNIKPPSEIHRLPKLLKDRSKWKATEWRSWLLFYSVPCLNGILDEETLRSYVLLVKSIYALLSHEISSDILMQVQLNLTQFVGECQYIYGDDCMTFNIHTLLHLASNVRKNGPLWATSAFPFESDMFHLKNRVTGPNGVMNQIVKRTLHMTEIKKNIVNEQEERSSWMFCKHLFEYRRISRNYERSVEGAILVRDKLQESQRPEGNRFNRIVYNDVVYHSTLYTRPKKIDNTVVELDNGKVVKIAYFLLVDGHCFMIVDKLDTCEFSETIHFDHIYKVQSMNAYTDQVSITKIRRKVVFVSFTNEIDQETEIYACLPPNTIEAQ